MKLKIGIAYKITAFLILCVVLSFCKKEFEDEKTKLLDKAMSTLLRNPTPDEIGVIPAATVELLKYPEISKFRNGSEESSLMPLTFAATLGQGGSVTENKIAKVTSAPPTGDILFMMDLTGSMSYALENLKANSTNIMNSISSIIGDAEFGVISHMDYIGYYKYCDYTEEYGKSNFGDYPYKLNQSITTNKTQVLASINSLSIGNGADFPESYARVLYETTEDNTIGWRSGARKFVVAWLDAPPHECSLLTGTDPGIDGIAGNADDLHMTDVLQELVNQNITLIVLNTENLPNDIPPLPYPQINIKTLWEEYAQSTGGEAFKINPNGTIPGDINIAQYIAEKIQNQTGTIDELTLRVCTPGFESWLSNVSPASYTDLDLTEPITDNFEATFTVPEGTADGVYNFDVCLIGDGAEYGRQHVTITVVNTVPVPLDIKPAGCPNPINRGAKGVLPVAILGFEGFDVTNIDPSTIRLEGIAPIRWAIEDVAAPYYPFKDKVLNNMSCNTAGPDGFVDLTLKFDNLSISTFLAGHLKGDIVKLHITGVLMDGTLIAGEDIVVIVK